MNSTVSVIMCDDGLPSSDLQQYHSIYAAATQKSCSLLGYDFKYFVPPPIFDKCNAKKHPAWSNPSKDINHLSKVSYKSREEHRAAVIEIVTCFYDPFC